MSTSHEQPTRILTRARRCWRARARTVRKEGDSWRRVSRGPVPLLGRAALRYCVIVSANCVMVLTRNDHVVSLPCHGVGSVAKLPVRWLSTSGLMVILAALAGCSGPAASPQVIEKPVTVIAWQTIEIPVTIIAVQIVEIPVTVEVTRIVTVTSECDVAVAAATIAPTRPPAPAATSAPAPTALPPTAATSGPSQAVAAYLASALPQNQAIFGALSTMQAYRSWPTSYPGSGWADRAVNDFTRVGAISASARGILSSTPPPPELAAAHQLMLTACTRIDEAVADAWRDKANPAALDRAYEANIEAERLLKAAAGQ
jgi:hypothetical protein